MPPGSINASMHISNTSRPSALCGKCSSGSALRDSVKWKVCGIRSIDQGVLQLLSQSVKLRREQLFETYSDMIPKTVTEGEILERVNIKAFSDIDDTGIGLRSWIEIENNLPAAADISGFSIACGSNKMKVWTFAPGTVLDAKQSIYVVADESNFLDDITSNAKDKYYFFVQHGNDKFIERLKKCMKIEGRSDSLSEEKKVFFSIEPRTVDRALKTLSSSPLSIDSSNCTEPEAGPWEEWGECCRGTNAGSIATNPTPREDAGENSTLTSSSTNFFGRRRRRRRN